MTRNSSLLTAVNALAEPTFSIVLQPQDDDTVKQTRVEQDPLLARLRKAIVGTLLGSHAGSSSGSERLPFNERAAKLYDEIESKVSEWYVAITAKPVFLTPERTLTEWHTAAVKSHEAGTMSDLSIAWYTLKLQEWAKQIEDLLDPPGRFNLTIARRVPETDRRRRRLSGPHRVQYRKAAACPDCEAQYALDPSTGDQILALEVQYREGPNLLMEAVASCGACGGEWKGPIDMALLAAKIEQQEIELNQAADAETFGELVGVSGSGMLAPCEPQT